MPAVTDHVPEFAPYTDDPLYAPFWQAAEAGKLALPACPDCGVFQWYPLAGRRCGHTGPLEWRELPGTGTIFSFTRVERAFLPSGGEPP
ncbi:MAG TPA: zinc ribbon domain-containing protein, partial [Streptosporangiaceae bacterium]|nr:zinc ribbon domain-containing protein [Streptosporangiaceae bacterium]